MRTLIKDLNKKDGTTIFISSHLLSEIERTCTCRHY
jgi:ABC-type multidrug transport system ATPase subunit